tara:strand:+ start:3160 stop:3618 length:459 start_codon:yes stop_codon:yes gene_type:complete
MSAIGKRKIWVGPADGPACKPLVKEGLAIDAFLPGTLVDRTPSGLETSTKAATLFGQEPTIAMEYGAHTGNDVDTAYTIGDTAISAFVRSGEFVNGLVAVGNNITVLGAPLTSNGAGRLRLAATDGTEFILFHADEIINVTGADALVRCIKV